MRIKIFKIPKFLMRTEHKGHKLLDKNKAKINKSKSKKKLKEVNLIH
jgi:hypothetical protein